MERLGRLLCHDGDYLCDTRFTAREQFAAAPKASRHHSSLCAPTVAPYNIRLGQGAGVVMAIHRLLQNSGFGPDDITCMTRAYEKALVLLRLKDKADPLTEIVAQHIIEVAKTGEKDSNFSCAFALRPMGVPPKEQTGARGPRALAENNPMCCYERPQVENPQPRKATGGALFDGLVVSFLQAPQPQPTSSNYFQAPLWPARNYRQCHDVGNLVGQRTRTKSTARLFHDPLTR